jgi:hypothetical protein
MTLLIGQDADLVPAAVGEAEAVQNGYRGRLVQVHPIKPVLEAPGIMS